MTAILIVKWWGVMTLLGAAFFPVTAYLFQAYDDRGWLFSKVLGLMSGGYVVWAFCTGGILPFREIVCISVTAIFAVLIWAGLLLYRRRQKEASVRTQTAASLPLIAAEEVMFLAVLVFWTWLVGFRPEASGTEKFMDFGFMAAMSRSQEMPAADIWYGTDPINYYYGGQYFAVFLAKLTGTHVRYAYNMMRALIAAIVFVLPFSIVRQLLRQSRPKEAVCPSVRGNSAVGGKRDVLPVLGGILASAATACAGNMHYVLYGLFGRIFRFPGYDTYWFPESTRYIGHNPPTGDACIHEFPSYSFVLGDLHAHMINLIFVLLFLGILTAWMLGDRAGRNRIVSGHILLLGAMTGMFKWTNYWDYIIYLTVLILAAGVVAVCEIRRDGGTFKQLVLFAGRIAVSLLAGKISAAPFTSTFRMMVSEVAISQNHTAFYQFAVLWGLPLMVLIIYVLDFVFGRRLPDAFCEGQDSLNGKDLESGACMAGLIALLLGVCAAGLILIPELVYVRDIYEDGYSRSNTMFKLTYQAYLMFALFMGYALPAMLSGGRNRLSEMRSGGKKHVPVIRAAAGALLVVLLLTMGYFPYSVRCWFGNIFDRNQFQGLDATRFIWRDYPEDAAAIAWADENIEGTPVVLEAFGDSYSDHCRVSAMTGLPTLEGWYVHEWLWRGDVEALNERIDDISSVYKTGEDTTRAEELLEKYNVQYIFVGSCEREQFPEMNEQAVRSLGEIVFQTDPGVQGGACIIKTR